MVEDKLMMKFTKFLLILGYFPNMNLTKLNLQIEQVLNKLEGQCKSKREINKPLGKIQA